MMSSIASPRQRPAFGGRLFALVLLFYLAAIAGFHRDFARLHFTTGIVPLFTGEAAIIFLAVALACAMVRSGKLPFRLDLADWLLVAYLVVGTAFTARGLAQGYGLAALRDFALVYYAVFYFFTRAYLAGGHHPLGPVWAMSVGGTAGATWQAASFLASPSLVDGHGAPSYFGLPVWISIVGLVHLRGSFRGGLLRVVWWVAVAVDAFVVYLSAYRTLIGVALAGVLLAVVGRIVWRRSAISGVLPRLAAILLVMGLAIVAHATLMRALPPGMSINGPVTLTEGLGAVTSRWWFKGVRPGPADRNRELSAGGFVGQAPQQFTSSFDASYIFRARAWSNAVRRIEGAPLTGIGFGPPAALYPDRFCELPSGPLSNCGNAHNTYLTLAMRMGIPVFLLFAAVNAVLVWGFVSRLRAGDVGRDHRILASFSGIAFVGCLAFALLSLFFESPYLAAIFWVVLGCIAAVPHSPAASAAGASEPEGARRPHSS